MNPINPYGSSAAGPSRGPEDNKDDPLRGVGGGSRFTRRGAIRGQKGVRGASGYLESRIGRTGGKKAHEAAAKVLGLGQKIKETGERAGSAVGGAVSGAGRKIAATARQVKSKIQEKLGGKKEKKTPEQIKMRNLAKEAKARVGKLVPGGKRKQDMYTPEPLGKPFKIPRPEVKIDEGSSSFSPDLGAIKGNKKPVAIPRAKVPIGKSSPSKAEGTRKSARLQQKAKTDGKNEGYKFSPDLTKVSSEKFIFPKAKASGGDAPKAEGTRKSERIREQKSKGILKQSGGPKTGGKGGIRWADQEGKPLEQ
ncbi:MULTISPECIES: hypothetical protein [Chlamydia]|uniref:Uncharacterized protein n=1 Tax=Chlamydia crocodili TaxID=2766982 RepID=A0ABX8CD21_9CHLA|nr:hypothetical protein [Chlamydia crocodili]QVE48802.1 hypothetical protein H9Q19_03720 [Chlamydia crocodili]